MAIKLLVADDHRMFVEGIRSVLMKHAFVETVDYALNGKEAIEKCKQTGYEVVLMDINMPVISGIEASRDIKSYSPETKIIVVSMLTDYVTVAKALKAGVDGYVLKNSNADELIKAMVTVLKGETYLSDQVSMVLRSESPEKKITGENYIRFTENLVSPRETQILKLIAEGYTDTGIAEVLSISPKTVNTHRKNLLAKLQLPNTAALVRFAVENGLI